MSQWFGLVWCGTPCLVASCRHGNLKRRCYFWLDGFFGWWTCVVWGSKSRLRIQSRHICTNFCAFQLFEKCQYWHLGWDDGLFWTPSVLPVALANYRDGCCSPLRTCGLLCWHASLNCWQLLCKSYSELPKSIWICLCKVEFCFCNKRRIWVHLIINFKLQYCEKVLSHPSLLYILWGNGRWLQ